MGSKMEDRTATPSVLHLDSNPSWGGGQNQIRLLMRELARAGITQLCICPRNSPLAKRLRDEQLPVLPIDWQGGADVRAMWRIFRALPAFDVVHCHDAHALQIALLPARLRRKQLVAARRVPFKTNPLKWNRADAIVAVSAHVRENLLRDGVKPDRIHVIHSGTDRDETRAVEPLSPHMRERHGISQTDFVVASAASLVPVKGQMIIPEAAELLPDVHWFIAGDGPMRTRLAAAIKEKGVADRVHLLGWLPDARRLFHEIDVYLSASTEDGLGNSITESLALRIPVVSADGGGGAEIMRPVHTQTGAALYEANNAHALAAAITRLRDPATRQRVIEAQNARFPDFDIHRTAAQTLELYHQLMRK